MLRWCVRLFAVVALVAGCGEAGRTFEEGVEHVPGPGFFVVRIEPAAAAGSSQIELTDDDGNFMRTFPSRRGADRYLTGVTLPTTLQARVDGAACHGSIELLEDLEADATVTIAADGCALRLDLLHRPGTIDHQLQDEP